MEVVFPLGGLNRRRAFRQQPPFTTPDCLNVRPRGRGSQRQRGGTRPGHSQVYPTRIGTTYITGSKSGVGTYDSTTGKSTFTAGSAVFTDAATCVGRTIYFISVTGAFTITDWVSTTQVLVTGNSTALGYASETFYFLTGDPVRMMHSFKPVPTPYITGGLAGTESDPFVGASDNEALNTTNWSTASWSTTKPVIANAAYTLAYNNNAQTSTAVFKSVSLTTTDPYSVGLKCNWRAAGSGATYDSIANVAQKRYVIWAGMDNATPVGTTNGIKVQLQMIDPTGASGNTWTLTVTQYAASVATVLDSFNSAIPLNESAELLVTIDESGSTGRVKVSIDGVEYATRAVSGTLAGQRCGFELGNGNSTNWTAGVRTHADLFWMAYTTPTSAVAGQSDDALLVASAGGGLFKQNSSGDMERIPSRCTFTDDRMFLATDLDGKLYMADFGDVLLKGSDGVDGGSTTTFDAASVADWTAVGIDVYRDVLVLLNSTGDLIDGAYKMTLAAGAITTTPACNTGTSGGCAWRIVRGPKVYDPQGETVRVSGTDGARSGANQFDAASVADWTALGITTATDVLEITKQLIGGPLVSYHTITTVHATNGLTVTPDVSAAMFSGAHYFRVLTDPVKIWQGDATAGTVPAECPCIARFRGRIVMGGAPTDAHVWYACRQGDALDWNYGDDPNDVGRAFAATNADLGVIGNPINAIAASSDDYCIFGCDNEIWVMRGDGAAGGSLQSLSHTVGIIGRAAWAWGPAGEFMLLSRDGIREIAPGASSMPTALSREIMPNELVDLSPLLYTPHMQYDARDGGFMVFATKGDGLSGTKQFWMEWPDRTFWPFDSESDQNPTASCVHTMIGGEERVVFMGGNTGLIWRMTNAASVSRDWYIVIGPLYPNRELGDGLVKSIRPVLGDNTISTLTWQIWACRATETEQEMLATLTGNSLANPTRTDLYGTWSAGINNIARPRVRAHAFFIRLTGENEVEFERLIVDAEPLGMLRV